MKKTRTTDAKVTELENLFAGFPKVEFDKQRLDSYERAAANILLNAGFEVVDKDRLETLTIYLDYGPDESLADYRLVLEGLVEEIERLAVLFKVDAEALFDEFVAIYRDRAVDAEF